MDFGIIKDMKVIVSLCLLAILPAMAVSVPPMPISPYADTKVSTNVNPDKPAMKIFLCFIQHLLYSLKEKGAELDRQIAANLDSLNFNPVAGRN